MSKLAVPSAVFNMAPLVGASMPLKSNARFLVGILLCFSGCDSFVRGFSVSSPSVNIRFPRGLISKATSTSSVSRRSQPQQRDSSSVRLSSTANSNTSKNPIERLSSSCIRGVMQAHTLGNENDSNIDASDKVLTNELLFVALLQHPERAGTILIERYGMDPVSAQLAWERLEKQKYANNKNVNNSDSNNNNNNAPLPLSPAVKRTLEKACRIADKQFQSDVVRSEHVLLALLGYNFGRPMTDGSPIDKNLVNGLQLRAFDAYQCCEDLVEYLEENNNNADNNDGEGDVVIKETVVVGGTATTGATLASVGVDLTEMAMRQELDAVFGRNTEITSALRTLGRRRKNNPVLIGEPGVGKTAIAEGIAQVLAQSIIQQQEEEKKKNILSLDKIKISNPFEKNKEDEGEKENEEADDDASLLVNSDLPSCPKSLQGARVVSINLASLVAGTANRGDFEKRVQDLIKEATNANVILFIDELHQLMGTGGGGNDSMNAANLLKPALARGEIRVLGATTTPEYRKYIEKDSALERRFQPLQVQEPSVDETIQILATIVGKYEEYHGVEYTDRSLVAAAKLSDRYVTDRFLPDKAIDMMDEAGSMMKMMDDAAGKDIDMDDDDFIVTEDEIAQVVADTTGIPVGRLDTGEKERLRQLESELGLRIKGQDVAVRSVGKAIRRARSGMRDGQRPVSSFLFCGPTGVGKTELCKCLAQAYFGRQKDMIRIDMSEYMDKFSVTRLVGAPPGYVGYEEGGQLTEAVRRAPHSLILLDELEKAHEDVLNVLLQVMDDGQLTDGKGRTVSFKNTILVMTSNVGSRQIMEMSRMPDMEGSMKDAVKGELEAALKPELLNRIDDIVVFEPLGYDNLKDIANNIVQDTVERSSDENDMDLMVSESVVEAITREALAVASQFGARPVRRAVQRYVEDTMAEAIMGEFVFEGDKLQLELAKAATDDVGAVVRIVNNLTGDSKEFSVDGEAGIGSADSAENLAYMDLPNLESMDEDDEDDDDEGDGKDDKGLATDSGAFQ